MRAKCVWLGFDDELCQCPSQYENVLFILRSEA